MPNHARQSQTLGQQETTCKSCNAVIVYTTLPSGKRLPLDRQPDERGRFAVVTVGGVLKLAIGLGDDSPPLHRLREAGQPLYTVHFDTCPNARIHRDAAAGE